MRSLAVDECSPWISGRAALQGRVTRSKSQTGFSPVVEVPWRLRSLLSHKRY